jgi:hypothetical protein
MGCINGWTTCFCESCHRTPTKTGHLQGLGRAVGVSFSIIWFSFHHVVLFSFVGCGVSWSACGGGCAVWQVSLFVCLAGSFICAEALCSSHRALANYNAIFAIGANFVGGYIKSMSAMCLYNAPDGVWWAVSPVYVYIYIDMKCGAILSSLE